MNTSKLSDDQSRSGGELPEFTAFKSTLFYSAGILVLPILSFIFSKLLVFDGIFSQNSIASNVCSAICAVFVLHIALGTFIYKAYSGPEKTTKKD